MSATHLIYLIEGPGGIYVGRTRHAAGRWQRHAYQVVLGNPSPLYAAMRRDGCERYTMRVVLSVNGGSFEACRAENTVIWHFVQSGARVLNVQITGDEFAYFKARHSACNERVARSIAKHGHSRNVENTRSIRSVIFKKLRIIRATKKALAAALSGGVQNKSVSEVSHV